MGNISDVSFNNSLLFNVSDFGVAVGIFGILVVGVLMSMGVEGCNMERTMVEGERGIDSMSVFVFLNSVGLE